MYTAKEKSDEAVREVKFRQRVYERMVTTGGMTRAQADRRIGIMAEIAKDYADLAKGELLPLD